MNKILILTIFIFISSCALKRTIDVADYNKAMQTSLQKADKQIKQIDADLEGHQNIQMRWSDGKSKRQLSKLTQTKMNIMQYYYRLKEDIDSSKFKESKVITSKDKNYEEFQKQEKDFEDRIKILNSQFDNYEKHSDDLNEYLATKNIRRVDQKKVSQDFVAALNESKKSQLNVKNELIEISVKSSPAQKSKIAELSKIVEKMENETFKLQRLYSASFKELEAGSRYVTPGMKTFDYEGKIKNHRKIMEQLIEAFNSKVKGL